MKSHMLTTRLNSEEYIALRKICKSNDRGDLNPSEMVRLLILREHNRRFKGTSKVTTGINSELRTGRPTDPKL